MQIVTMGTPAENLTGRRPVILAKALDRGMYACERISDGRRFLIVQPGAHRGEALAWAKAAELI